MKRVALFVAAAVIAATSAHARVCEAKKPNGQPCLTITRHERKFIDKYDKYFNVTYFHNDPSCPSVGVRFPQIPNNDGGSVDPGATSTVTRLDDPKFPAVTAVVGTVDCRLMGR
jgi:hypothetical protein